MMTAKEIKNLKYEGKRKLYKVESNLYVEVLKDKKVYRIIVKKENKQIKATIDNVDNITLTEAKRIKNKITSNIAKLTYKEAFEYIRKELKKRESKNDKKINIEKLKENEKFILKNIIQEFLQTRKRQDKNRIENYIIRFLGNKDVRKIKKQDIIEFFKKVKETNINPKKTTFQTNKMQTIKRLKSNLNLFYKYLYLQYDIEHNPIANLTLKDIEKLLGEKYVVKHFKATTNLSDIQKLYQKIKYLKTTKDTQNNNQKITSIYTKLALEFLLLTALRQGTLRKLTWDMINWEKNIIEIPAEITKTKRDFRLPLTKRMLEILEELKKLENNKPKGLLFKGRDGNLMSENTLNVKIKKLTNGASTAHGIRSSFATILKEQGENPLYIEEQLMHIVENKVGQAYTRTDYLEQRRELLEKWNELINSKIKEKNNKNHISFTY